MKTLCVIDEKHDITRTWLFRVEDDGDPVEAIRKEFESDPDPDDWDDLKDHAEWFYLKRSVGSTLRSILWPKYMSPTHEKVKATIYRKFAIRKVTFIEALAELDNDIMEKAIAKGWEPPKIEKALDALAWAMEEKDQAETYRESIMEMAEDIEEAVQATEWFYEDDAAEFLKDEHPDSEPEDPNDMSFTDLVAEATALNEIVRGKQPAPTVGLHIEGTMRLLVLEAELVTRGYSVLIERHTYTVTKEE